MKNIFVEMFYRYSSCSIVNRALKYLSLEGGFESVYHPILKVKTKNI